MAEQTPKKRPNPVLLVVIVAALIFFAITIFVVLQGRGGGTTDEGAPPELGPDTAQAAPTLPTQTASADPAASTATNPAPPTPPTPGDPTVATASASGSAVTFADDSLSFSAALPEGAANDPVLAYLRKDSEGYLGKMKSNARADYDRLKKFGVAPMPWEVKLRWVYTAKADNIVSLAGVSDEYAGGAHPIQRFDTLIARADSGKKLDVADMMKLDHSPSPAMMIALCEALKDAKTKRIKSATINDEPIVCAGASANAKTDEAKLALAPSNQPGKFGGIYAYYEPYAVGPYAEGSYRLTVQQEIFAEDLRPEFKPLFGGVAPILPN